MQLPKFPVSSSRQQHRHCIIRQKAFAVHGCAACSWYSKAVLSDWARRHHCLCWGIMTKVGLWSSQLYLWFCCKVPPDSTRKGILLGCVLLMSASHAGSDIGFRMSAAVKPELNEDVWLKVFGLLSYRDLLFSCMSVSREWRRRSTDLTGLVLDIEVKLPQDDCKVGISAHPTCQQCCQETVARASWLLAFAVRGLSLPAIATFVYNQVWQTGNSRKLIDSTNFARSVDLQPMSLCLYILYKHCSWISICVSLTH